jgi:hypothetical protein
MGERSVEEFLAVVRRDLGGEDAVILDADEPSSNGEELELTRPLPGGRRLVVRFASPPGDAESRLRRLDMLVDSFRDLLSAPTRSASRPPPAHSLHEELAALARRAGARDALVIDAHSPVVWGTAGEDRAGHTAQVIPYSRKWRRRGEDEELLQKARRYGVSATIDIVPDPEASELVPRAICERRAIAPLSADSTRLVLAMVDPGDLAAIHDAALATGLRVEPVVAKPSAVAAHLATLRSDGATYEETIARMSSPERLELATSGQEEWARHIASRRVIPAVRALPEMATLHKGGHVHRAHAEPDMGYIARSFAGIYVLVLVFDAPYDELLAKRATLQALPAIERLVLALPPRDPVTPAGGAKRVALRPRRRT